MTGRASSSSSKRPRSRSFLTGASLFLLSLSFHAKSAVGGSTTEEDGVVQWGEFTAEKSMTIYGAYDAKKTIKFEFKPESGHDVYRVADLAAFNACDLTDATKMDEVCFHHVMFFFCFPPSLSHSPSQKCVWRVYSTALYALTFFHDRSLL